jgi:hypothetical protein
MKRFRTETAKTVSTQRLRRCAEIGFIGYA